jgi:hypothetical protein
MGIFSAHTDVAAQTTPKYVTEELMNDESSSPGRF